MYNDKTVSLNELLEKDVSGSIYHQNIRQFAIQMLKVFNGLSPEIIKGILQFIDEVPYNLRQRSQFLIPLVHVVFDGTENIKFLGPKIWEFAPDKIKQLKCLREFIKAIKQWKPRSCPYRICNRYTYSIEFL